MQQIHYPVFFAREWMFGGIQSEDSFDNDGRYIGQFNGFIGARFFWSNTLKITTDLNRFVKPLVATNVDEPTNKPSRNIETTRQHYANIISYPQLKKFVLGLEALFGFERKTVKHKRKALHNIAFGDPVYSEDKLSFDENDDSLNNTILAVADSIITTHSKPFNGPGGSVQVINLQTRFFPD